MKSSETLRTKFGANMRESVGGEAASFGGLPAVSGSDRLKGISGMKRALLIPVAKITPDPDQPRKEFDKTALAQLAESLKTRGQLQPVRVRFDEAASTWILISGERRWRAAQLAGLDTLQAVEAKGPLSAHELLEDQLVENCVRENLKPIDQANAFRALMDAKGLSHRQLADRLSISPSAVTMALSLLGTPEAVQDLIDQGALPASVGYEISKLDDPAEQAELATRVVAEGLTRADVATRVAARKPKAKGKGKPRKVTAQTYRTAIGPRVTVECAKGLTRDSTVAALMEIVARIKAEQGADADAA